MKTAAGTIAEDWRTLHALPDNTRVMAWGWPALAADVKRSMRERLQQKISSQLPWYGKGRKWQDTYQHQMMHDARAINNKASKRIRFYQILTPELHRRFSHLIDDMNEI